MQLNNMGPDKDEAVRVAEDAAGIIDAGWHQGGISDGEGNYCAIGALRMAALGVCTDSSFISARLVEAKMTKLVMDLGGYYSSLPDFNDHPTTTQSQVSDMFRMVAKDIANNGIKYE